MQPTAPLLGVLGDVVGEVPEHAHGRVQDDLPETAHQMVFHAGTTLKDGAITATGGRVLNATTRGATLQEARDAAYALIDTIDWPEGICRRDIGWRALK